MPRALLRMLIYKDDFEEYIDFLRTAKCKSIPVDATVLERQDGRNDLNFLTPCIPRRNLLIWAGLVAFLIFNI